MRDQVWDRCRKLTVLGLLLLTAAWNTGCEGKQPMRQGHSPDLSLSESPNPNPGASQSLSPAHSAENIPLPSISPIPSASQPSTSPMSSSPAGANVSSIHGLLSEMRQALGIEKATSQPLSAPPVDISEWLQNVSNSYDGKRSPIKVHSIESAQADGLQLWAAVMFVDNPKVSADKYVNPRQSIGIVVTKQGGAFALSNVEFPYDQTDSAQVETIVELTGDSSPEIVWKWENVGAHTNTQTYYVSTWQKNAWAIVPDPVSMPSVTSFSLKDRALILKGGLIDSVGAGPWQRQMINTYKYVDGHLMLTDSIHEPGTTAHHRLMDGFTSESVSNWERAAQAYGETANQTGNSSQGLLFQYRGTTLEGGTDADFEGKFYAAVHALARLRLHLLELDGRITGETTSALSDDKGAFASLSEVGKDASDREQTCKAVSKWADNHPDWLELLNAPYGYANKKWNAGSVCAKIGSGEDPANKDTIALTFQPVAIEKLNQNQPKKEWTLAKTITFSSVNNKPVMLNLYTHSSDRGSVFAMLDANGDLYELGEVGNSFSLDEVKVVPVSYTFEEQLQVLGGVGTSFTRWLWVAYDFTNKSLVSFGQIGSPQLADLDGNGKEELVASFDGVHLQYPDVSLMEWRDGHLQSVNVAGQIGITSQPYSRLSKQGSYTLIGAGSLSEEVIVFYTCRNGSLMKEK